MRQLILIGTLFLAFTATGCREIVAVEIRNAYDLQVEAWDNRVNGAYEGAKITVIETNDVGYTGPDGWTPTLKTPRNAQSVRLVVQWFDRHGYPHSYSTSAWLQHQVVTKVRVWVDTTPPQ